MKEVGAADKAGVQFVVPVHDEETPCFTDTAPSLQSLTSLQFDSNKHGSDER